MTPLQKSLPVSRRAALATTAAWLAVPNIHAQPAWPAAGPIKPIVQFAPGGSTDGVARQIVDELRSRIGQTVRVDNRRARAPRSAPGWWPRRHPMAARCWCR